MIVIPIIVTIIIIIIVMIIIIIITRMNVNSFQDRENVTPCQEIAKQRPSKDHAKPKKRPSKGQAKAK